MAGGANNRVVDVFWGSRPFETITQGRNWTALTEYGATLLYERDDSGFVIISIYPANTDNRKPIESSITLQIWLDPIKLKRKSFIKKNWDDLIAYMECTSLDGNPTLFQRLRISYLRTFKNLIIDNKWTPTRFSSYCKDILKFVLTVGLSGFIIYLVTLLNQSETNTEKELKEVNKKIKEVSTFINNEIPQNSSNVKTISITADSINKKTNEILKIIENNKPK